MTNATLGEAFETAIVDGINMFVREGLNAKGPLHLDGMERVGQQDILEVKYKIAKEIAQRWVVWQLNFGFREPDEVK